MNEVPAILNDLGDKTRFAILCQLYRSDSYVELLASRLGLTPGTVSHHLKKLETDGLVSCSRTQFYMIYSLNRDFLGRTVESFLAESEMPDKADAYREKVIASFFECGRLKSIPVQQKKREIVLEEVMRAFEAGREYPEKEVNALILEVYDDYCTLRRWLVADGYLAREREIYTVLKK